MKPQILTLLAITAIGASPSQTQTIEPQTTQPPMTQIQTATPVIETAITAEHVPDPTPTPTVASSPISGSKTDWMAAAGIPQSEWQYVDFIVSRESSWNPNAVNPSSGACGLGQQLPCGKWPGAWNDPVAALKAQHQYVTQRYGSYEGAVAFWKANRWY